jgi:hypothetical protein
VFDIRAITRNKWQARQSKHPQRRPPQVATPMDISLYSVLAQHAHSLVSVTSAFVIEQITLLNRQKPKFCTIYVTRLLIPNQVLLIRAEHWHDEKVKAFCLAANYDLDTIRGQLIQERDHCCC